MWSSLRTFCRPSTVSLGKFLPKQTAFSKPLVYERRAHFISTAFISSYPGNGLVQKPLSCCAKSTSPASCRGQQRYLTSGPSEEAGNQPKQSLVQRFKSMYKDYWYVLIPVHVVTSCVWFAAFFYTARSGFDIAGAIEILNLSDEIMNKIRTSANSTAGHITLSYLLYKIFTPLRYTVTLGGTTYAIKHLTARGLLKKMPKREELKKMMVDKKDSLKDKKDNLKKEFVGKFSATKKSNDP